MTSHGFRPNDFRCRDFRRRADAVRAIPLEVVLTHWGAERDGRDRSAWRTARGPLSVTEAKFFNWHLNEGGGGAIDLVMHLSGQDVAAAVGWLEQHLGSGSDLTAVAASVNSRRHPDQKLSLPQASLANLPPVQRYLTCDRGLDATILGPLIDAGKIYADGRGNAVFVMVAGKANRPIGAELRGTGRRHWRGLAPGTRKDTGYFWIGAVGSRRIVLCESAIDAISCFQLNSTTDSPCLCISTAGVRSGAPWLYPLLSGNYDIYCGFDDDEPGNRASCQMIARHRTIKRLRPPAHDWNDALRSH